MPATQPNHFLQYPDFDTLIINANLATFNEAFGYGQDVPYGQLPNGSIAIKSGKIVWIGQTADSLQIVNTMPNLVVEPIEAWQSDAIQNALSSASKSCQVIDVKQQWITPSLIDCHTHLVYAGNRSDEFELRLNGVDYATIAKQGGGILSTVKATRQATFEQLYQQSCRRLRALLAEGVTTIEIKSGYGLDLDSERKMLQVARQLGKDYGITVKTTYLAAHALPPEYQGQADAYIDKVCEWLEILHAEGLVDAVDAFCENIAFNLEQVTKVFTTAKKLGLPVKLHAEQLSNMGGSGLVATFGGLSADHIEHLSFEDTKKLAQAGTVGVLLPTAFYVLRDTKLPPIDKMRECGVKMAVSTDCNPGTSPSTSLQLAINMACTLFRLTPEEALAGVTVHAAHALGVSQSKGQIAVGMDADLAIWDITRPADLAYLIGLNPLTAVMVG